MPVDWRIQSLDQSLHAGVITLQWERVDVWKCCVRAFHDALSNKGLIQARGNDGRSGRDQDNSLSSLFFVLAYALWWNQPAAMVVRARDMMVRILPFLIVLVGAALAVAAAVYLSPWWWMLAAPLLIGAVFGCFDFFQQDHTLWRNFPLVGRSGGCSNGCGRSCAAISSRARRKEAVQHRAARAGLSARQGCDERRAVWFAPVVCRAAV